MGTVRWRVPLVLATLLLGVAVVGDGLNVMTPAAVSAHTADTDRLPHPASPALPAATFTVVPSFIDGGVVTTTGSSPFPLETPAPLLTPNGAVISDDLARSDAITYNLSDVPVPPRWHRV